MRSITAAILFFSILVLLSACRDEFVEPVFLGTIKGEVVLADDFTPLENVRISTSPASNIVLSGADGTFVLDSLPAGSFTIHAQKEGYRTELENVTVHKHATTEITILMQEKSTENTAPGLPFSPEPANAAIDVPIDLTLSWAATDADETDTLTYDLIFFEQGESPDSKIAVDLQDSYFELTGLEHGTTYYWQVIVKDGEAEPVFGEIWRFETEKFPEHRLFFTRKEAGQYNLYCSDFGGNEVAFYQPQSSQWRPHLSPDRQTLAYLSNEGVDVHLYIRNPDGTGVRQVSTLPLTGYYPLKLNYCWSPASDALLYMNGNRLYRINTDGNGLQLIAEAPANQSFIEVDWAGNNDIIARTVGDQPYESQILLCDENGTQVLLVEDLPGCLGGPKFSIDGKKILYTMDVDGYESPDGRQLNAHIFLKDLESGEVWDLSSEKPLGTNDLDPQFSPTGAKVIFTNGENDDISPRNIWTMDLYKNPDGEWTGTNRTLITENGEMPDWN